MKLSDKPLKSFFTVFLALLVLGIGTSAAKEAKANLTPTEVVLELLHTIKKIKKPDADQNIPLTSEEKERNGELSHHVNRMIDIRGISAYALWEDWEKQSPPNQNTFVAVFTELLAKVAYTNAGSFMRDVSVSVRKEKVLKNKAMVYTSVVHEDEGRIDIDFKLHHFENAWLVNDVFLDGVSLARNLRSQCLKIVQEHSFEELLSRMRKRITEEDAEELKEITGKN